VGRPIGGEGAEADRRGERDHQVRLFFPFAWINGLIVARREDDTNWPKKNIVGKQELEIRVGNDHIAFEVLLTLLPHGIF
jgi:hypothetical protein